MWQLNDPFSSISDFQLKRKKKLVSQLSLRNVEVQSHTFQTTKWIALYLAVISKTLSSLVPISLIILYKWTAAYKHPEIYFELYFSFSVRFPNGKYCTPLMRSRFDSPGNGKVLYFLRKDLEHNTKLSFYIRIENDAYKRLVWFLYPLPHRCFGNSTVKWAVQSFYRIWWYMELHESW